MFFKKDKKSKEVVEEKIEEKVDATNSYYAIQLSPNYEGIEPKGKLYSSLEEFYEDYSPAGDSYSQYLPTYLMHSPVLSIQRNIYIKNSEADEVVKSLVELPEDLREIYPMFDNLPQPFFWENTLYVKPEELEFCKKWISEEITPEVLPGTENDKSYFFKLKDQYFESSTPSYWLFLYKQFGYLDVSKLKETKNG